MVSTGYSIVHAQFHQLLVRVKLWYFKTKINL